jgi:hypothetical protein
MCLALFLCLWPPVVVGTVSRIEDYTTRWDRLFVISLRGTF